VTDDSCYLHPHGVNIRDEVKDYYVYIMANGSRTLYTGFTNNLPQTGP
jgi:hypothetical protein